MYSSIFLRICSGDICKDTFHTYIQHQHNIHAKEKITDNVTNGKNVIQNKSFMALLKPIQNHGHCSNSQPLLPQH